MNAHIQYHVDCTALLADIEQRFVEIADELGLKWPVHEKFQTFARNIKKHSPEYIVARGEWFTAHLMAEYLDLPFVDAADVVVFHHDGNVDMERTAARLKDVMVRKGCFVLPGFYGATVDGQIKLFQRGGGDITGAILARCIDAGLYENWTDVSGFLSATRASSTTRARSAASPSTRCASSPTWAPRSCRRRPSSRCAR